MIAHIIHDAHGAIRSVVLQGTEAEGSLEIEPTEAGEFVTVIDLREAIPDSLHRRDVADSDSHLHHLAQNIRTGYVVDRNRGALRKVR